MANREKVRCSNSQVGDPSRWISSFPHLKPSNMELLHKKITDIEIKNASFMMDAFKAPSPDGLRVHFFHIQWSGIGMKVCQFIWEAWEQPGPIRDINHTRIVLLPKIDNPLSMKDFRPISLCNVNFKIITKVIANRLKGMMSYLIQPQQCSFISGRQSSDNIIIAQEAIHTMITMTGKKVFVALKVDMEKAYDRLDCSFLSDTLSRVGMSNELVKIIITGTSSSTMKILWNGEESHAFSPTRGVRQGDPLSPYLFVLCMERLGHLIDQEGQNGKWKGLTFNKDSPMVSHTSSLPMT